MYIFLKKVILEVEPWCDGKIVVLWSEGHGSEFGNNLSVCEGKTAYIYHLQTPHGDSFVYWAASKVILDFNILPPLDAPIDMYSL